MLDLAAVMVGYGVPRLEARKIAEESAQQAGRQTVLRSVNFFANSDTVRRARQAQWRKHKAMNSVLMLVRNNLDLTKRAIESVRNQDIPTELTVVDNDSSDGFLPWVHSLGNSRIDIFSFRPQLGVSAGWNTGLRFLFRRYDHVLVLNNDVVLPRHFYHTLLEFNLPFITGMSVEKMDGLESPPHDFSPPAEAPDFSAFLIRKSAWEAIGEFDEAMVFYAQDNDYHVRAHRLGIPLLNAHVPFYHERSSTLRHASADDRQHISEQSNADRAVFKSKYQCEPWESAYADLLR